MMSAPMDELSGSVPHAVLLVHGIGDQTPDWASSLIPYLFQRIERVARSHSLIGADASVETIARIRPAYWAEVLQSRQRVLSGILRQAPDLVDLRRGGLWGAWKQCIARLRSKERHFVSEFIGDIIGYRESGAVAGIQQALLDDLHKLEKPIGRSAGRAKIPLTFVAHSLGCVIVSDFVWDQTRKRAAQGACGFHPLFELRNLFTIGSPLSLFSLRYGSPDIFNQPIAMEHPSGRWVNIYDRDDPIAMPLKALNAAYDRVVLADALVQSGLYLFSHDGYFTHNQTLDIIAQKVALDWAQDARAKPEARLASWAKTYDRSLALEGVSA